MTAVRRSSDDLGERSDDNALGFQALADALHEGEGGGIVAVHADGIGGDRNLFTAHGRDHAFLHHADGAGDRLLGVTDDGAGELPGDQRAVGLIGAVGKDFTGDAKPRFPPGFRKGRAG